MRHPSLCPQDVIVLLRVRQCVHTRWTYSEIAEEIGLSASQVHASVRRAVGAGLMATQRPREQDGTPYAGREVRVEAFTEFLIHGARYAFPPQTLTAAMGWPTAYSHPTLSQALRSASGDSAGRWVWPSPDGPVFGTGLMPLHPCALGIAAGETAALKALYTQLAMFDELRVGGSRGRKFAGEYLRAAVARPGELVEVR